MPAKSRYQKNKDKWENKCPTCGRLRDSRDFVTCSRCRKRRKQIKSQKIDRREIMRLFGIGHD